MAFLAHGDSKSVVVEGSGHIVGTITGGSGVSARTDVSYVTPAEFIFERMEACKIYKPNASFTSSTTLRRTHPTTSPRNMNNSGE